MLPLLRRQVASGKGGPGQGERSSGMQTNVVPNDALDQALWALSGWTDVVASREIVLAIAALVVYFATAPRGRRWLAWEDFQRDIVTEHWDVLLSLIHI